MYVLEVRPLTAVFRRFPNRVLSFYHPEELPPGSLVEVLVRGRKTKGVVITSRDIKYLKIRIKKEASFELKPVNRVLDKNPPPNKDPLDVTLWFPAPAKKKLFPASQPHSENLANTKEILKGYLENLAERKVGSKAKNYMQETAEQYLKYINWENDTFETDMRLFWVTASNYYRTHTHHDFVQILEWLKKKDSLNPKQVAKLFNKN